LPHEEDALKEYADIIISERLAINTPISACVVALQSQLQGLLCEKKPRCAECLRDDVIIDVVGWSPLRMVRQSK
jgi:hypothetical protein